MLVRLGAAVAQGGATATRAGHNERDDHSDSAAPKVQALSSLNCSNAHSSLLRAQGSGLREL